MGPPKYWIDLSGTGVCHVTVSFRSGAADFGVDVKVSRSPGACCPGLVSEPSAVIVPESGPADAATD